VTTLFLIRHGENDYLKKGILIGNTPGVYLNQRGRQQAVLLAEALQGRSITAIYSSPLERALETAAPLASLLDLGIITLPELSDTNVGDWSGRKITELKKLPAWKQIQEHPAGFEFPGGGSFLGLQKRLVSAFDIITSGHKMADRVAIFFHADPIKLVLSHYLGLPLDFFQRLSVDTGSVSVVQVTKKGTVLVALNLIPPFSLLLR
jgi:broad specificity phosphatase PhoE